MNQENQTVTSALYFKQHPNPYNAFDLAKAVYAHYMVHGNLAELPESVGKVASSHSFKSQLAACYEPQGTQKWIVSTLNQLHERLNELSEMQRHQLPNALISRESAIFKHQLQTFIHNLDDFRDVGEFLEDRGQLPKFSQHFAEIEQKTHLEEWLGYFDESLEPEPVPEATHAHNLEADHHTDPELSEQYEMELSAA